MSVSSVSFPGRNFPRRRCEVVLILVPLSDAVGGTSVGSQNVGIGKCSAAEPICAQAPCYGISQPCIIYPDSLTQALPSDQVTGA